MRTRSIASLLGVVMCLATSCTTAQVRDENAVADVKAKRGAFLSGKTVGLGVPEVVNRRDFIYAMDFGDDDLIAFVHHVTTNMEVTATQIEPLRPRFQQPVNSTEFDVEDVLILDEGPGRGTVALPSRQGIARAFDAKTGAPAREIILGAALIRVAASPDQSLLAFGSADGRVFLVDAGTFAIRGQGLVHGDEIHGLAFLSGTRLASSSFDGTLKVTHIVPGAEPIVRAGTSALKGGERVFLAHLDGTRAVSTVRDTRQPACAVTTAAAKRLGLAPRPDGATVPVVTAAGPGEGPGVVLGNVHIQTLSLGALDAAVCDACVPPGAELVLGQTAIARAKMVDDIARDELVVTPGEGEGAAKLVEGTLSLAADKSIALPGPATDIDVSRDGKVLVTFSHEKAARSFEINDAERRGVYPEPSPQSAAAFVDVDKGVLGKSFVGHRGFTVTGALSPDGRTVVTGGWDKRVIVFDAQSGAKVTERELAWLIRRVRFAPEGHLLGVAAWTPVNALNEGNSEPALLLYPVALESAKVNVAER